MSEIAPQPKPKQVSKIIVFVLIGLILLLGTFIAGFVVGAIFVSLQENTNWGDDTNYDYNCGGLGCARALKPVIYLYPTETLTATVRLNYDGKIVTDIPTYNTALGGWQVKAEPDGTLLAADGKHYPYLFWEGIPNNTERYQNPAAGFVVAGSDTEKFLRSTLPRLGLIPSEYEEFIAFWVPKLEHNPYTLIHFAGAAYQTEARLTVDPKPDSVIRVFMVTKTLDQPVQIKPQILTTPQRDGFTVVEWGGTILQ